MNQPHRIVVHVLPLLLALILTACSSSGIGSVEQKTAPASGGEQPGFGAFLPGPQSLLEGREHGRSASALEESFIEYGDAFDPLLPNQHALLAPHNAVEFQPSWSDASGKDSSKLAYCIYSFTLPGYDREAELHYGWGIAPPEIGTVWFGLSDWQHDTWDWVPGEEDGVSAFGSTAPYFNDGDEMLVVVVCANDDICVMRYLRLGEMPPADIVLEAKPRYSRPPVTVFGNATDSTMPVGTIEQYEWDWDNDGTFEETTGTDPISMSDFDSVGDHTFAVRLTSSYGEQATGSDVISVVDHWTHSWGTNLYQDIGAIDTDNFEFCYSAGSTMRSAGHRDALLLKHDLGGELVWAAAWGGEDADEFEDVQFLDGAIFTVGQSDSYGAGDYDVLLQRWDEDGNVEWSRVWGTAGLDRGDSLALTDGYVYVVGDTMAMGNMDVLLLKYDFDGSFIWARTWGDEEYDAGADIASSYHHLLEKFYLYVTGSTCSPDPLYEHVLYLQFDEDAAFDVERAWRSDTEASQYGGAISVYGWMTKDVYIAGSVGEFDQRRALLLEVGSGTGNLARAWSNSTECVAEDVLRIGDTLYTAGRGWDLGLSSGGFVLEFSLSGSLQNSAFWADANDNTGITALHAFPGSGLLVGGNCEAADLGSWAGTSGTLTNPGGTWSDYSGTVNVPAESTGSPPAAALKVTSGIIDTGGGDSWDALLSIVQFP